MKKALKYTSIVLLGLSLGACKSFVDDLDVDPNNPAVVDAANSLQGVILADALVHEGDAARTAGIWTNQFSGVERQYISLNNYDVNAGTFDDVWGTLYYGAITQARLTASSAETGLNNKLKGVAQVLEAHAAGTTTALFGDVPFREAASRATIPNPKFDPQTQVYADLQSDLDDAIKNLAGRGTIPATKDIIFNGDASKWSAVANSLKARYYLHIKDYPNAKAFALKGIVSPANDMVMPHQDISGAQNIYYFFFGERAGYLSATDAYAPKLLDPKQKGKFAANRNNAKTDETERFNFFYTPAPATAPSDYGLNEGEGFSAPDAGFPLVTYSETQLILAEANLRIGAANSVDALAALNKHRAALAQQFPKGKYDPYTLLDIPGGASGLLTEVLTEKYVTLIGQIEAFNDARRTKNAIGIPVKGSTAKTLPQRFLYPQSEINTNPNVPSPLPGLYEPTPVNR